MYSQCYLRFPDIGYFRDPQVQTQLTNILFLYSATHSDIGYRQGMHELLAPLFYAVDFDSITEGTPADPELAEYCSRTWVAADAWVLFRVVMGGVNIWYAWQEPPPPPLPPWTPWPPLLPAATQDTQTISTTHKNRNTREDFIKF